MKTVLATFFLSSKYYCAVYAKVIRITVYSMGKCKRLNIKLVLFGDIYNFTGIIRARFKLPFALLYGSTKSAVHSNHDYTGIRVD